MNLKKKLTAAALVVAFGATAVTGATLAYFTDTDNAENVFTVGKVDITLTEPDWNADTAKLIPGREIAKDPTITVESDSERAYTFMRVELSEDFAQLLTGYASAKNIKLDTADDWKAYIGTWFKSDVSPKIMSFSLQDRYVDLGVLSPKDPDQSVQYFDAVTIPKDVDATMIKENGNYKINITAYAIQAEGFEGKNADKQADRQAAYDALFTK